MVSVNETRMVRTPLEFCSGSSNCLRAGLAQQAAERLEQVSNPRLTGRIWEITNGLHDVHIRPRQWPRRKRLLLCAAGVEAGSRMQLCGYGSGHPWCRKADLKKVKSKDEGEGQHLPFGPRVFCVSVENCLRALISVLRRGL
jgi:hypothetical protein